MATIALVILPDRRMSHGRLLPKDCEIGCSMCLSPSAQRAGLILGGCMPHASGLAPAVRQTGNGNERLSLDVLVVLRYLAASRLGPHRSLRAASSDIRLKFAVFDHAYQFSRYISILAVEHIEKVAQLAFAPVDFVN
jgi:hypothetical protein